MRPFRRSRRSGRQSRFNFGRRFRSSRGMGKMLSFTWLMYAIFMAVGIFAIDFMEKKIANFSTYSWGIGLFLLLFGGIPAPARAFGLGALFGSDKVAEQFIKLETSVIT